MRFATLLLALIALASPALADEPVVVLRGSSAPPTPWYEPPPEPKVVVQPVYVPLYYLPVATYNPLFFRQHLAPSAKRNR
ncbi:MAG TPA: hypothetical protein VF915_10670 [Reyranella sp.]|jgi:hypothetical protein